MADFETWLPPIDESIKLELPHFPTAFQTVIFRLWENVSAEKLAEVLHSDVQSVTKEAVRMGLPSVQDKELLRKWRERGYITIIKAVWHVLPYEQIMQLLDLTRDELSFILLEDDFLYYKLGECKPECEPVYFRELTVAEMQATARIRKAMEKDILPLEENAAVQPFDFFREIGEKQITRAARPDGAVEISEEWFVEDLTGNEDCGLYAGDFVSSFEESWGIKLKKGSGEKVISLALDAALREKPEEYHEVEIRPDKVLVKAGRPMGIMRGLYFLLTMMDAAGGPYLKEGVNHRLPAFDARYIYSYCGLYGGPLDVDTAISFPDELLKKYARTGVNGVWLQAVLYKMVSFPFDPSISKGYRERQEKLRELIARARRWGLKVYLYINEPRAMPLTFFEKYPHLKGFVRGEFASMCTSQPEVQKYLSDSIKELCTACPGLGGFFCITVSENQTNCYSHASEEEQTCPRCKNRTRDEVVSEVNSIIADAAHEVDPEIKTIAWTWAWKRYPNDERIRGIRILSKNCIVQNTSEEWLKIEKAGIKLQVDDYTLSNIPPSENSISGWKAAKESGHRTSAKVQLNTTWEGSTSPFIPVYENVCRYMQNLRNEGVDNIQLSWTLGGWPSDNLRIASAYFFKEENPFTYEEILKATYGDRFESVKEAVHYFCEAFACFPFHIDMLYLGPQNAGPSNLLFEKPTGLNATMTCFAYDDLEHWKSVYPEETFMKLLKDMRDKWNAGLDCIGDMPECEFKDAALTCGALFESTYNAAQYVILRRELAASPADEGLRGSMRALIERERELALRTYGIMTHNATIGYEAANHYYFSKGSLAEKVINCDYLLNSGVLFG